MCSWAWHSNLTWTGKCYIGYLQGFMSRHLWIILLTNTEFYDMPLHNLPFSQTSFNIFHFIWITNPGNCNDLQCFIPGECRNSLGLDILPSTDKFQCLKSCQENSNCTWFSFFPDSNVCQTFSSCENIDKTLCPNCISGQRGCESQAPICFVPGNTRSF